MLLQRCRSLALLFVFLVVFCLLFGWIEEVSLSLSSHAHSFGCIPPSILSSFVLLLFSPPLCELGRPRLGLSTSTLSLFVRCLRSFESDVLLFPPTRLDSIS